MPEIIKGESMKQRREYSDPTADKGDFIPLSDKEIREVLKIAGLAISALAVITIILILLWK
jgi:hypothetical protein